MHPHALWVGIVTPSWAPVHSGFEVVLGVSLNVEGSRALTARSWAFLTPTWQDGEEQGHWGQGCSL